jgi:hypothetical protein
MTKHACFYFGNEAYLDFYVREGPMFQRYSSVGLIIWLFVKINKLGREGGGFLFFFYSQGVR